MGEDQTSDPKYPTDTELPSNSDDTLPQAEDTHPSFSIVPDPKYYVTRPDGVFNKIKRMIETSRGAVIGLTGVRGAGKSVLLRKVEGEFKDKHYTFHITAPTSSSQETAFFVMLYRQLCESIHSVINEKIFGKRFDALNIGIQESRKRTISYLIILSIAVMICICLVFMGFHALAFKRGKAKLDNFAFEVKLKHTKYIGDLYNNLFATRNAIEEQKEVDVQLKLKNKIELQKSTNQARLNFASVLYDLGSHVLANMKTKIDSRLIPHPAVIAFFDKSSKNGFEYKRDFLESRGLVKYYLSWVSNEVTKQSLSNQINSIVTQVRKVMDKQDKQSFYSAMLTTISDSGRADFDGIQETLTHEIEKLEKLIHNIDSQLSNLSETRGIEQLKQKYTDLLEKVPEEGQKVSELLGQLQDETSLIEFKPYELSTWTDPMLPYDQTLIEDSESADPPRTIIVAITDTVAEMAKFVQFLESNLTKEQVDLYIAIFNDAKTDLDNFRKISGRYRFFFSDILPYPSIGIIVILILCGLIGLTAAAGRRHRDARLHKHELGLLRTTESVIQMLDYNITRSRSTSVKFPLIQKISGSLSFSEKATARTLTLPGLTAHYITYIREVQRVLRTLYGNTKIIICIDELDKINDAEQLRNVLREIKGALYVEDCFYLLSISEDAVRAFEGRFVDERDIFESTFDEIFYLERLDLKTCEQVAFQRLLKVDVEPEDSTINDQISEAIAVAAILSTGVPREFLRNMRVIITEADGINNVTATSAWHSLFKRKLFETFEKVRSVVGLETLRAALIEEIERLISIILAPSKTSTDPAYPVLFDLNTTRNEITHLESRLSELSEEADKMNKLLYTDISPEEKINTEKNMALIDSWKRKWLELLIFLYLLMAYLSGGGKNSFKTSCKELIAVYAMLPYSYQRSRQLLKEHAAKYTD